MTALLRLYVSANPHNDDYVSTNDFVYQIRINNLDMTGEVGERRPWVYVVLAPKCPLPVKAMPANAISHTKTSKTIAREKDRSGTRQMGV